MSRKAKVNRRVLRSQNHPDQGHNRLGILWIDMDDAGRAYCWECKVRIPWCDCRQPRPCDCTRCRTDIDDLPDHAPTLREAWAQLEPHHQLWIFMAIATLAMILIGLWVLGGDASRALTPDPPVLPDRSILAPRNTY